MNYKNIYLLFILVIAVLFFSLVGCNELEGMDGDSVEELAVPVCNANNEICKDDMFMLKTSAIPPVCPSCPPYIGSGSNDLDNNTLDDGSPDAGSRTDSNNLDSNSDIKSYIDELIKNALPSSISGTSGDVSSKTNIKQNSRMSSENNESTDITYNIDNSIQERSIDIGGGNKGTSSNSTLDKNTAGSMNPSHSFGTSIGSVYSNDTSEIQSLRSELAELKKNSPDRPCPACERCPEPAFDCKKVPNYRSSAVDQYLPMPVLNDFSSF
jgi:hypothetical protein